jgi:ArsR family transcriptional regulator
MDAKSLVKLAKSLSDPTRLRMLQEIARAQRLGCANLYEFVPISQPSMRDWSIRARRAATCT